MSHSEGCGGAVDGRMGLLEESEPLQGCGVVSGGVGFMGGICISTSVQGMPVKCWVYGGHLDRCGCVGVEERDECYGGILTSTREWRLKV